MRDTPPATARVRVRAYVNATKNDPRFRGQILAGRTIVATEPGDSGSFVPLYLEDLEAILDAFNTPEGDDTDDPAHRGVVKVRAENGMWFDVDLTQRDTSNDPPWLAPSGGGYIAIGSPEDPMRQAQDRWAERFSGPVEQEDPTRSHMSVTNYMLQAANVPLPEDDASWFTPSGVPDSRVMRDRPRPLPTPQERNDALHEQLQEDAAYELNRGFNEMNGPPGPND